MTAKANDTFLTGFQHIFAAFCVLMTETCIFLFFSNLASKLLLLLITGNVSEIGKSNRIQREFDSNGAIATFDHELSAPKNKPYKLSALTPSPCEAGRGLGCGDCADTNRIQREFLFNNCIQSQNPFPASSPPRQKTNLLKRGVLSLRATDFCFSVSPFLCVMFFRFWLSAES
jgi:hypothetical protein